MGIQRSRVGVALGAIGLLVLGGCVASPPGLPPAQGERQGDASYSVQRSGGGGRGGAQRSGGGRANAGQVNRSGDRTNIDQSGDRTNIDQSGDRTNIDQSGDRTNIDQSGDRTNIDRSGNRTNINRGGDFDNDTVNNINNRVNVNRPTNVAVGRGAHNGWWGNYGWARSAAYPGWWGTGGWTGVGGRPLWWGTVPYVANSFILVGPYYYPYYSYGGYYYPDYSSPFAYANGAYAPVSLSSQPSAGETEIAPDEADVVEVPEES